MAKLMTTPVDSECNQHLLDAVNLNEEYLTKPQQEQLKEFIMANSEVFALDPSELGTTDIVTHSVNTSDHPPIRQHPRRTLFALRSQVTRMVGEMLTNNMIQPSNSPWASPVVLVENKDHTFRFCVDYQRLNSITKMEFLVMPFGLCNAPVTFQRLMETVLSGLVRDYCVVYLDNILVVGEVFEAHLENLQKVLDRLKQANLRLKPKKCQFGSPDIDYLGYHVSGDGLSTDKSKTEAIANFPWPTDLKTLCSFLGLVSYYRRFIPCLSKMASPLHLLTQKDAPFDLSSACEQAFGQLKQYLTNASVLAFPLFDRNFLLETDASGSGLGTARQDDETVRPIAFASCTLQPHETNYGSTELEALAVVWAVKHFCHYLYGHKCHVYTNTPHQSGKLARWGLALQRLTSPFIIILVK